MKRKIKSNIKMKFKIHSEDLDLDTFKNSINEIDFGFVNEQGHDYVDGENKEYAVIKVYFKKDKE